MRLRIFFRDGIADADGRLAGYKYLSIVVDVPAVTPQMLPEAAEVIGGEWIREEEK